MGEAREETPGVEARSQLLAIERGTQQMTLEREVLADGAEARELEVGDELDLGRRIELQALLFIGPPRGNLDLLFEPA